MKLFLFFLSILLVFGSIPKSIATDTSHDWLPIGAADIARLVSVQKEADQVTLTPIQQVLSEMKVDPDASAKRLSRLEGEVHRLTAEGDDIWFARREALPYSMVLAGKGEHIHSVKVTVPMVNMTREEIDETFQTISEILVLIYPDWDKAKTWPTQSLQKAWDINNEQKIIVHEADGIVTATFGVPPDIVVYTITSKERCVPDRRKGNLFRRLIC